MESSNSRCIESLVNSREIYSQLLNEQASETEMAAIVSNAVKTFNEQETILLVLKIELTYNDYRESDLRDIESAVRSVQNVLNRIVQRLQWWFSSDTYDVTELRHKLHRAGKLHGKVLLQILQKLEAIDAESEPDTDRVEDSDSED